MQSVNIFKDDFIKYTKYVNAYYKDFQNLDLNRGYSINQPTQEELKLFYEDIKKYDQYIQRYNLLVTEHERLVDIYPELSKQCPELEHINYYKPYDYASNSSLIPNYPLTSGDLPPLMPMILNRQHNEGYNWFIQMKDYK